MELGFSLAEVQEAQQIITLAIKEKCTVIEWVEQVSRGLTYDPVYVQLTMSVAATQATADVFTQAVFDLCGEGWTH